MTYLALHRTHFRTARRQRGWRGLLLLAAVSFMAVSGARAQTIVGDNRPPSVSVDSSVLDALGPAPTLPQLFSASQQNTAAGTGQMPQQTAPATAQHAAQRGSSKSRTRLARAPVAQQVTTASDHLPFHLIPPAAQTPSAADTTGAPPESTPPSQPTETASGSPVPAPPPLPTLPQSEAAPTPPVVPPTPAHVEAPNPPRAPPTQASSDAAPVALTAAPPAAAPAQTAAPEPQAAPATDNATSASPPPAPTQIASAASIGSTVNTVKFAVGAIDLPPDSQPMLDTVAAKLMADDTLRVQLIAHASGSADQAMEARRISLARAVAVRAYLIDKGVRSLRMDVRALGNRADNGPPGDQVDLLIVSQ